LIKKIVAINGDIVKIEASGIWVNDELLPNSKAIYTHNGIKLSPQQLQILRLKANEYFMLGKTNTSYDSRYFGIVKAKQIAKKAILMYSW
ncbi:MAG: signal peptidase I, partial [Burkholderiales bacterium]|nr:signal peptidase I [Burkholderiales bacterium]